MKLRKKELNNAAPLARIGFPELGMAKGHQKAPPPEAGRLASTRSGGAGAVPADGDVAGRMNGHPGTDGAIRVGAVEDLSTLSHAYESVIVVQPVLDGLEMLAGIGKLGSHSTPGDS